ncbi:MAG: RsmB/NOP family class I SAM-dependent RNA methyltransferase [Rhodospirillales bacterium]|nr:RsmB/NOP family class I SAM-dependent RNA methyltransferase [Rhodospirillales bacterium]
MTPGARIAAAIELLEAVDAAEPPIEPVIDGFVRARRYMGSKDRRSVTNRVYGVLRRRHRLDWWLEQTGHCNGTVSARARLLADLILNPDEAEAGLDELFSGEGHGPEPLGEEEKMLIEAIGGETLDQVDMPDHVALEYPAWLDGPLRRAFRHDLFTEMRAINIPAAIDLRVNAALIDRDGARETLAAEGIDTVSTDLSPLGLRLLGRANLKASAAYRDGLVEVQDEGSQVIALLAGAEPGMTVIDVCAGAGGKTLALGADMARDGRIDGTLWACDVEEQFLKRLIVRAGRAKLKSVKPHVLADRADPWLDQMAGQADLVLVDAPCSGSGTWRRHPAAKWWLTEDRLAEFTALQSDILGRAAKLIKAGGRLVYATCSVLAEENKDRVEAFLASHPEFGIVPVADIWAGTFDVPCPAKGDVLRLTPATTGTDGFFCAVMERAAV